MSTVIARNSYMRRLVAAAALDPAFYEEIEADRSAIVQATATVILSSAAAAVGARGLGAHLLTAVAFTTVLALATWAAWALLTFQIGAHVLSQPQTQASAGQLFRTIGFATAPGCLRILGVLPGVAVPVFAVTALWMLAAMVVAVRQALDYTSTWRALAVCGLGWGLTLAIALAADLAFGSSVF